jgi:hypothetical protein
MLNGIPSFSLSRRWSIRLNVTVSILAALALVLLVNFLAARHSTRLPWSARARAPFSPLTRQVLASVTNEVKVTIFYDQEDPLYDAVWSLLKEYKFANPKILVEAVDYTRERTRALLIKNTYKLGVPADNNPATVPKSRNLVIFECQGRWKVVEQKQLSEYDLAALIANQTNEVRRTHFRGEGEFTSALLSVITPRPLKAYFLLGHGEHRPDSTDSLTGYSEFASVLQKNSIQVDRLILPGTNEVPADCNLLIIAGPKQALATEELDKIDGYLKQGGRLFLLFNYESLNKPLGLEMLLQSWRIAVGNNVVVDHENSVRGDDNFLVYRFADHPLTRPIYDMPIHVVRPRTVGQAQAGAAADAPQVTLLALTGVGARVLTDIRAGVPYPHPTTDYAGMVPVVATLEKGTIRGVNVDRGQTRMVVAGDSFFLDNEMINSAANRDFAHYAVNWLMARNDLLVGLPPQPIKEYKLTVTEAQMAALRWLFLLGMPGAVLFIGFLVWMRRRN